MKLIVGSALTQVEVEHWMESNALSEVLTTTYGDDEFCYIDEDGRFPTGLLKYVIDRLGERGITAEVEDPFEPDLHDYGIDEDYITTPDDPDFKLRDYQLDAIHKAIAKRRGIIKIATGGGKTEIQAAIARALGSTHGVRTLTVVTGLKGVNQTYKRFIKRGVEDVGRLGGDHWDIGCKHIVVTAQSLYSSYKRRDDDILALLNNIGLIQFDECHHEGSNSWFLPGMRAGTDRRLSYSATPFHETEDKNHPYDMRLVGLTGPVLVNVSSKYLRDRGFLVNPTIYFVRVDSPNLWKLMRSPYNKVEERAIVSNDIRNSLSINIARAQNERHRVAFLVRRIAHGQDILQRLHTAGISAKFCRGGSKVDHWDGNEFATYKDPDDEVLEEYSRGDFDVLIGSGIFDEVVDLPVISCLIILSGGKKAIRSLQRVGRAIRPNSADPFNEECLIFDFDDNTHPWMRNHSRRRKRDYLEEDYVVNDRVPISFMIPKD